MYVHVPFLFHGNHSNFQSCKGDVSTLHIRGNGSSETLSRTLTATRLVSDGVGMRSSRQCQNSPLGSLHETTRASGWNGAPCGSAVPSHTLGHCPRRASSEAEASLPHPQPLSARPWTHRDVVGTSHRGYGDWAGTRQASDREPTPVRARRRPKSSSGITRGN